jgi:hypothetical protein
VGGTFKAFLDPVRAHGVSWFKKKQGCFWQPCGFFFLLLTLDPVRVLLYLDPDCLDVMYVLNRKDENQQANQDDDKNERDHGRSVPSELIQRSHKNILTSLSAGMVDVYW